MFKIANAFAQAILVLIITFILILILGDSNATGLTVIELISEIPLCNVWIQLLGAYTFGKSNPEMVVTLTLLAYVSVFVDAFFVGIIVHVANSIKREIERITRRRTVNILSTYLATMISVVVIELVKKSGELTALVIELAGIAIMFWLFRMLLSPGKLKGYLFDFGDIVGILVDSVYAVMVAGYITKMVMVVSGMSASLVTGIIEVIVFSIVIGVAGYVAYLLTGKEVTGL